MNAALKTGIKTMTLLAWGLWLGGLIALFIFVVTLFREDHDLAVQTAPRLFHVFETYQLGLALVAVCSAAIWKRTGLVILFSLAMIGSIVSPTVLTPRIMELNRLGQTNTDAFRAAHGESMMVYTTDSAILLLAGLVLQRAIRKG